MSYLSLYRKWRPQTFADVVGQEHVVRTLRNALDMGRCAHAYIFSGPRGTGKTTLARLLAKGLNCAQGPTGTWCNECDNCQRISRGHSVDVIEIDGASNRGIDEIRDVREKVKFAPAEGRYKVYIIDEVHMLTTEAFNALLKVLEEPPEHVIFIFATTEAYRIPATIVSRCQKFDFHGFSPDQVAEQVRRVAAAEGAEIDEGAIHLIARHAAGGMRDALGFLDQCISFADEGISENLVAQVLGVVEQEQLEALARQVAGKNLADCLAIVKSVVDSGRDLRQFARDLVQYFRDLMLLKAAPGRDGLVVLWGDDLENARNIADSFEVMELLRIVERLGQCEADMRWAQVAQLPLEIALIELLREDDRARDAAVTPAVSKVEKPKPVPPKESPSQEPKEVLPMESAPIEAPPTEAPARPPSDMPSSPEADGFLGRIQKEWQQLLDHLRASKFIQQEAFLREGMPGTYEDGVLTVYFSPNHRFHQANIAQDKNKEIVVQAIKKVFGEDVVLEVVLGQVPASNPKKSEPVVEERVQPPQPPAMESMPINDGEIDPKDIDEPVLKAALELFGGTITRLEREGGQ